MHYKGLLFSPLVIESIGMPLSSPIAVTKSGNAGFAELLVPMTLCSLAALHRDDWIASRTRRVEI